MNIDDLCKANPSIKTYIEKFVKNPLYLELKDAFVSHTPTGTETEPSSLKLNHGKYLGTRHVFNKMEDISRQPKEESNNKKGTVPSGSRDPDLEE